MANSVQGMCFTQVHRARLTFQPEGWNNMPVAVKTIFLDEGSWDRVKQEVAILEKTSNLPNVVGYYKCDYVLTHWAHHIVMELMEVREGIRLLESTSTVAECRAEMSMCKCVAGWFTDRSSAWKGRERRRRGDRKEIAHLEQRGSAVGSAHSAWCCPAPCCAGEPPAARRAL